MPVRASQANPISDSNQVTSQSSLKNLQKELHNGLPVIDLRLLAVV